MTRSVLEWLMLIGILLLTVWGVARAWRAKGLVRWLVVPPAALVALILVAASGAAARGLTRLYGTRGRPVRELHVSMAPERVARGQHIANAMCADCHTKNKQLPLSGGNNLSEDAHMPLGDLVPFNLTPGGPLKDWTDGEIFRAIREAADKDGRKLPVMSSQHVRYLSDEDLESVIAYLRSQPAVNAATTPERFSLLSVVFAGANMLPIVDTLPPSTIAPPDRATATSYGKYIVGWYGCQECHGEKLQGGGGGVLPVGPDLRSVQGWTEAGFVTALRTGVTPFGKTLDSTMMPWKNAGRLDDDELRSVYAYLKSLPSVVQAGR